MEFKALLIGAVLQFASAEPLRWVVTDTRLPVSIGYHSALYDGGNFVYVIGGTNGDRNGQVYRFALVSGIVDSVGHFPDMYGGAVALQGEHIHYLGGYREEFTTNISTFSTQTGEARLEVSRLPVDGMLYGASAYDRANQVLYTFGGMAPEPRSHLDTILRYDLVTNEVREVGRLPRPRYGATAVWNPRSGLGYVFGGDDGCFASFGDVLEFDPGTGGAYKLTTRLPASIYITCSVYADGYAYIFHEEGLIRFSPEHGVAEEVEVDIESWPVWLGASGCAYVPWSNRIYVLGGLGYFHGEEKNRYLDEISYIELSTVTTKPINPIKTTEKLRVDGAECELD